MACSCPVERIYEELDRRERRERNESAECLVEERLMRWADEKYAELRVRKEAVCYYDDDDDDDEEELIEEYVVGVDGNTVFTSIDLDGESELDETTNAERAEKIRELILRARTWEDFHRVWDLASKYIDDAELETELA
jgi:hypothetical protein